MWRISYSFSRVKALVSNPKLVSAHNLVKELMDLDNILLTLLLTIPSLRLSHDIFVNFQQSYGP